MSYSIINSIEISFEIYANKSLKCYVYHYFLKDITWWQWVSIATVLTFAYLLLWLIIVFESWYYMVINKCQCICCVKALLNYLHVWLIFINLNKISFSKCQLSLYWFWRTTRIILRHYSTSRKMMGSRPDEVNFSSLPNPSGHTRPWGHSAYNRNEFQKQKNNVSGK
jgi:hypothetical protein